MATAPDDSRAAITGAVLPQPGPHMPPRYNGIPRAREMEDWQLGLSCDGGWLVPGNETVAAGADVSVCFIGPALDEFIKLNSSAEAMVKARLRAAAVELAEKAEQRQRNATAAGLGEADSPRPGMAHEAADED